LILRLCLFLVSILSFGAVLANNANNSTRADSPKAPFDQTQIILNRVTSKNIPSRIQEFSDLFLSLPYIKDPLGEGPYGRYDQDPRFRFDGFDCTTFVETVSSLALSTSKSEFIRTMDGIRYRDGVVAFQTRNHFTDLDWIPNNIHSGFVVELTTELFPDLYKTARTTIDKPQWYRMLGLDRIHNFDVSSEILIEELHRMGSQFRPLLSTINFVPIDSLVSQIDLIDRIPNGSIINFVRADWNLKKYIGTNMNVSHQGFAIRKADGILYFRHASSELKRVTEEPLSFYLQRMSAIKSISGINIIQVKNDRPIM